MRWPAPIKIVVAVVIRPHSVARRRKNLTLENIEAEANQYVQISGPHLLDRFGGEAMNKTLAHGLDCNAVNTRQHGRAIHGIARVLARSLAFVELKIKVVEQLLAQVRIAQPVESPKGSSRRNPCDDRTALAVNQEFDSGKVAGLNMLDHSRGVSRHRRAIQQQSDSQWRPLRCRVQPERTAGARGAAQRQRCCKIGRGQFWTSLIFIGRRNLKRESPDEVRSE